MGVISSYIVILPTHSFCWYYLKSNSSSTSRSIKRSKRRQSGLNNISRRKVLRWQHVGVTFLLWLLYKRPELWEEQRSWSLDVNLQLRRLRFSSRPLRTLTEPLVGANKSSNMSLETWLFIVFLIKNNFTLKIYENTNGKSTREHYMTSKKFKNTVI